MKKQILDFEKKILDLKRIIKIKNLEANSNVINLKKIQGELENKTKIITNIKNNKENEHKAYQQLDNAYRKTKAQIIEFSRKLDAELKKTEWQRSTIVTRNKELENLKNSILELEGNANEHRLSKEALKAKLDIQSKEFKDLITYKQQTIDTLCSEITEM